MKNTATQTSVRQINRASAVKALIRAHREVADAEAALLHSDLPPDLLEAACADTHALLRRLTSMVNALNP